MSQTVVDISRIKDGPTAAALDALGVALSGGGLTSIIAGTAAAEMTFSRVAANVNGIVASGSDTNISILIDGAGTGKIALGGLSGTAIADAALQVVPTASCVDFVEITGSVAGSPGAVIVAAKGTDTDIDLALNSKGAGTVKLAAGSFIANASVATVLGSVGPTGSHTTVQKWIQLKDNAGTVLYVPCF